jgi:hypothetical protein
MTTDAVITMVILLGGVWGGFLFLLLRTVRADQDGDTSDNGHIS